MQFTRGNPIQNMAPMNEPEPEKENNDDFFNSIEYPIRYIHHSQATGLTAFANHGLRPARNGSSLKHLPQFVQKTLLHNDFGNAPPDKKRKNKKGGKTNEHEVNVSNLPGYVGCEDVEVILKMFGEQEATDKKKPKKKSKKKKSQEPKSQNIEFDQRKSDSDTDVGTPREQNPDTFDVDIELDDEIKIGSGGDVGDEEKHSEDEHGHRFSCPENPQFETDVNWLKERFNNNIEVGEDNSIKFNRLGELFSRIQAIPVEHEEEERKLQEGFKKKWNEFQILLRQQEQKKAPKSKPQQQGKRHRK